MKQYTMWIGTQNPKEDAGIYQFTFSEEGKILEEPKLAAKQPSPTYFYLSQDGKMLYAVSEPGAGKQGLTCAYKVNPQTKELNLFGKMPAAGRGLCHIAMDSDERYAVVTCYEEATIQVYPVDEDRRLGSLFCLRRHTGSGPVVGRQEEAHAHSATFSPDGKYLIVCDLGTDQLCVYTFNYDTGKLHRALHKNVDMPAGSGPRHMVFSPNGRYAYVACELSSQLITLSYDPEEGFAINNQQKTLSPEFDIDINYPSAIRITRDGQDLYLSNRGEDTIAHFHVDPATGLAEHKKNYSTLGWFPRDFILTQDDQFLVAANQRSEDMVIFRRTPESGELTLLTKATAPEGSVALMEVPMEDEV